MFTMMSNHKPLERMKLKRAIVKYPQLQNNWAVEKIVLIEWYLRNALLNYVHAEINVQTKGFKDTNLHQDCINL